ncbi:MAG: dephospho-CoA kinase [Oligoflexales bacterium]
MVELNITKDQSGKLIGLTGGIASGKSTAAEILKKMGCLVINADQLGHETYQKGNYTYNEIISFFGNKILDKQEEIDRRKLGSLVFADKTKLNKLCDIVWPEIKSLGKKKIVQTRIAQPQANIILEAAVLLEASWDNMVDEVWVIYVEPDLALKRLMSRNQLSLPEAQARLAAQMTNTERLSKANASYENKGSIEMLKSALEQMLFSSSPG